MTARAFHPPYCSAADAAADRVMHCLGIPLAAAAACWLLIAAHTAPVPKPSAPLLIYSLGLVGTLGMSAAYSLWRPGAVKNLLRTFDHVMIFVMIAGTYTPFALTVLERRQGILLVSLVWGAAAMGIAIKLIVPRLFERAYIAIYLIVGWLALAVIGSLIAVLPAPVLALLLAGGVVYSAGAVLHEWPRMWCQTAVWHFMVLMGAGLHFGALTLLLGR